MGKESTPGRMGRFIRDLSSRIKGKGWGAINGGMDHITKASGTVIG